MVRPKAQEPKQQFTVMLKPSVINEIDKLAKKVEISRSQMISNLIEMALEEAKGMDKAGLLTLVKMGKKAIEYFRSLMKGRQEGEPMKG